MIASNIARRYARAVLELGAETNTLDAMVRELADASAAYEASEEFRDALENPLVSHEAKHMILDEVGTRVGASAVTKNLLKMLCDRRRLRALPRISQLLTELADARKGIVHAEVTTAVQLSDSFYERLKGQLERMTGQKIVLNRKVDPTLVGGVSTRMGDTIIDGSLRASLAEMRTSLLSAEVTRTNGAGTAAS
ncbi:MAG TPA: ATP synthase F1 subunit delta [Polyangiaceae bacterium]|nr:ATP synthase F1 subunit delta [Polyangiaceae bacterium]